MYQEIKMQYFERKVVRTNVGQDEYRTRTNTRHVNKLEKT